MSKGIIEKTSAGVSTFARWFAGLGLLVMTTIIGMQVFARYVLNDSPPWAEQAALLLMIWYVFIAAAAGIREGFHIRIGVFADNLAPSLRQPVRIVAHLIVAAFGVAMIVFGIELTSATWQHVIPTLSIPRGFAYIPIALSGLLITGFSLEQIIAELRDKEVVQKWN
ncbi:MAG: TRAP transporter small permease [Pseudomonadota bacterium]